MSTHCWPIAQSDRQWAWCVDGMHENTVSWKHDRLPSSLNRSMVIGHLATIDLFTIIVGVAVHEVTCMDRTQVWRCYGSRCVSQQVRELWLDLQRSFIYELVAHIRERIPFSSRLTNLYCLVCLRWFTMYCRQPSGRYIGINTYAMEWPRCEKRPPHALTFGRWPIGLATT